MYKTQYKHCLSYLNVKYYNQPALKVIKVCDTHRSTLYIRFHSNKTSKNTVTLG